MQQKATGDLIKDIRTILPIGRKNTSCDIGTALHSWVDEA